MAHKKIGWLKDAVMKDNGIFSENGEKLISGRFAADTMSAFNGKAKKVVAEKKKEKKSNKTK